MLDAATLGVLEKLIGPLGVVILLLGLGAIQAFFGGRGKNSAYPARDEKHDANVGAARETQQLIESSTRLIERHLEKQDGDLSDLKVLLEIIKDRTHR